MYLISHHQIIYHHNHYHNLRFCMISKKKLIKCKIAKCFSFILPYISYYLRSQQTSKCIKGLKDNSMMCFLPPKIPGRFPPHPRSVSPNVWGETDQNEKNLIWPKNIFLSQLWLYPYEHRWGTSWGIFWAQSTFPHGQNWFLMNI